MNGGGDATGHRASPTLWPRALLWLACLGPFFFASYGFTNWISVQRQVATEIFFAWERAIPFLPWTIVPYWSIDLLYALSFFLCRDRAELDRHGLRLLTAQLIAVTAFLLFPLHYSFERPATGGFFGAWFDALQGFDLPYNQAPALHVSLLVILWARYAPWLRGPGGAIAHVWFALIGVSVLTTYQHHFIDVPTGALSGFLCLWLWPDRGPSPLSVRAIASDPRRRRLAMRYIIAAAALAFVALAAGGAALWLAWATVALALVALCYLALGPDGFRKRGPRHSLDSRVLFAPYTLLAWINSRLWTWRHPQADAIADGVAIGRMPTRREMTSMPFAAMVDLCAELPAPVGAWRHVGLPWLDLVAPDAAELRAAAACIEAARSHGDVLVCCALGYSRSAVAVAAWLLVTGRSIDADQAMAFVGARRRQAVFGSEHRAALRELRDQRS